MGGGGRTIGWQGQGKFYWTRQTACQGVVAWGLRRRKGLKIFRRKTAENVKFWLKFQTVEQIEEFFAIFDRKQTKNSKYMQISTIPNKFAFNVRQFWQFSGKNRERLPKPILCRGFGKPPPDAGEFFDFYLIVSFDFFDLGDWGNFRVGGGWKFKRLGRSSSPVSRCSRSPRMVKCKLSKQSEPLEN